MAAPQGVFHWPGVWSVLSGSFTLGHGISPSICTLQITSQPARTIQEHGTLRLTYGRTTIEFPGCRATFADTSVTGRMTLRIEDRRWKWQYRGHSGHHNLIDDAGELDESTERTPQQLATSLLKAMGETGYNVANLPNNTRPEVRWDFANPAAELARLVSPLSTRIVLDTRNRVSLHRKGVGRGPTRRNVIDPVFGMSVPGKPDALFVKCGPIRFQNRLLLEAVEENEDGGYDAIPAADTYDDLFFADLDDPERSRKQRSVFRVFRVKAQADGSLIVPGTQGNAENFQTLNLKQKKQAKLEEVPIANILPLSSARIETQKGDDGVHRPLPARVVGNFWDGGMLMENTEGGEVPFSFNLDGQNGLVVFSEPVMLLEEISQAGGFRYRAPELWLECSYSIWLDNQPLRHGLPYDLGGKQDTGPLIIHRNDIDRTVVAHYTGFDPADELSHVADSIDDANQEASKAVLAQLLEYEIGETATLRYPGFLRIDPDGLVQQVRWDFGESGAFTTVSLNSEFDLAVSLFERREEQTLTRAERGKIIAERRSAYREALRRRRSS